MTHRKFVEHAAGAFMVIGCKVSRWNGSIKLPAAARQAAIDAGADPTSFNGYVNLLGRSHSELKHVKSMYDRIYTYLYENALPFERGKYLVLAVRAREVEMKIDQLIDDADKARDKFLREYSRLMQISLNSDMGAWSDEVKAKMPSVEAMQARFGAEIKPPKPMPVADMSRMKHLPADYAAQIAERCDEELRDQLEAAKLAAMDSAHTQMKTLAKQLDSGKRLHESLISNSKRTARLLRDMSEGYDRDPRVIALADLIDEKISNVPNTDTWKTFPDRRTESLKAAQIAADGLEKLKAAPPVEKLPAKSKAKPVVSDVLADLI